MKNRQRCRTALQWTVVGWCLVALRNLLSPVHSHLTLAYLKIITYHRFIRCHTLGGIVS